MKRRSLIKSLALISANPFFSIGATPRIWDHSYDIIVVGSGGAGLAAATKASQYNKSVLLIEKMDILGGNTLICGGYLGVVDPIRQKKLGIVDSIEKHFRDIWINGDKKADPEVVWTLVNKAPEMLKWIESLGMRFQDNIIETYGSHFARCHLPVMPNGTGYIATLSEAALKNDVEIRRLTPLTKLYVNDEGRVTGLQCKSQDSLLNIEARKGVILGTGGFGANPSLIAKYAPRLKGLTTDHQPGNTGDALKIAVDAGAELIGMDRIQCIPGIHPDGKIRVRFHSNVSRFIFVDQRGLRFTEEELRRDVLRDQVLALPEKYCWSIVDNDGFNQYDLLMRRDAIRGIETGDAYKGKTLVELAKKIQVPPDNLVQSVSQYNEKIAAGGYGTRRYPIKKAPFWACKAAMTIHCTMGGIKINSQAACLNSLGKPIPGLYAAGECTGSVQGTNRIGGNGTCDALTFGMIAGQNCALS